MSNSSFRVFSFILRESQNEIKYSLFTQPLAFNCNLEKQIHEKLVKFCAPWLNFGERNKMKSLSQVTYLMVLKDFSKTLSPFRIEIEFLDAQASLLLQLFLN